MDTPQYPWPHLVEPLLRRIDELNQQFPDLNIRVLQIKEKFGELRFYWVAEESHGVDVVADALYSLSIAIENACALSASTCEVCGAPATTDYSKNWIRTVCEEHTRP